MHICPSNYTEKSPKVSIDFIAWYFQRPLMWSRVWDVVSSSFIRFLYFTASAGAWDNQLFSSPTAPPPPFVYLKVFILLSRLCCTMSMISMGKQTNSLCPRVSGLGLSQAYLSLFGPVALVYPSRQHRKSVMTGMLGLSGRVKFVHGWSKKYEHNAAVMNLPLYP